MCNFPKPETNFVFHSQRLRRTTLLQNQDINLCTTPQTLGGKQNKTRRVQQNSDAKGFFLFFYNYLNSVLC